MENQQPDRPKFSTTEEAAEALDAVLEICQRLPVGADQELTPCVGAHAAFHGAIRSMALVSPEEAAGTAHYRQVHGLAPIQSEDA